MSILEIKNLSYKYPIGKENVLEDVSFKIEEGQFVSIIGKNGSGKTTLCNILRGLIPHTHGGKIKGEVLYKGKSYEEIGMSELAKYIGFVFQNPFIQISGVKETVFDEIAYGLENLGVPREEIMVRVQKIIDLLKINDLREKHPAQLSGGQRQRIALASVLVMEPEILIIDEPTSQLDPQGSEEVFEIIELMKENNKTIILVEHKMDLIAEYSDRIILIDDKKVIYDDVAKNVLVKKELMDYGVQLPQTALLAHTYQERAQKKLPFIPITLEDSESIFSEFKEVND